MPGGEASFYFVCFLPILTKYFSLYNINIIKLKESFNNEKECLLNKVDVIKK